MSGLQPGFALNEKQAGRLWPAPRAVWAGLLGTGRRRGGHTGCAWRASHQHGRLGGPASQFRPAPAGRQCTALEADGAGSASGLAPPSFCNFWEPWGSWPLSLPTLKMGLLTSPRVSHGTELGSRWNASERVMSEKISEGSSVFCFHSSSNRGSEKFKNSPKVTQQGTGK